MNFKEWVGLGILCGAWVCGEGIVAVLIEAALGNQANSKTGQGSGEKFGYGATRIGSALLVEADRRIWGDSIRARPRRRMSAFLKSGRWGDFGLMSLIDCEFNWSMQHMH